MDEIVSLLLCASEACCDNFIQNKEILSFWNAQKKCRLGTFSDPFRTRASKGHSETRHTKQCLAAVHPAVSSFLGQREVILGPGNDFVFSRIKPTTTKVQDLLQVPSTKRGKKEHAKTINVKWRRLGKPLPRVLKMAHGFGPDFRVMHSKGLYVERG
ncbi:conserved hypothetical protein [Culex quinquefasciatus]|uniref:Uncharacterized protein n=1 Tax=Culex quinquefasciatus TaxID=7176 RepID=B0X3V2_CULQU|nr:conserved hypothetical protein [Culex quinquefasciatus]|eukprot:XP_001864324.1 conserved hypothetical protein [Culex quinquefasciatus]